MRTRKPSLDSECSEISLNGEGGGTTVQGRTVMEETSYLTLQILTLQILGISLKWGGYPIVFPQ